MSKDNMSVRQIGHRVTHAWYNMCKGKLVIVQYDHGKLIGMW